MPFSLYKNIKKKDRYGHPIHMNFDKETHIHHTFFGGLVSIFFHTAVLALFVYMVTDFDFGQSKNQIFEIIGQFGGIVYLIDNFA